MNFLRNFSSSINSSNDGIRNFCVGGRHFAVSEQVLKRGGLKNRLLNASGSSVNGVPFFDRSPDFFAILLNFLRYGYIPQNERKKRALACEMLFFCIDICSVDASLQSSLEKAAVLLGESNNTELGTPKFMPEFFEDEKLPKVASSSTSNGSRVVSSSTSKHSGVVSSSSSSSSSLYSSTNVSSSVKQSKRHIYLRTSGSHNSSERIERFISQVCTALSSLKSFKANFKLHHDVNCPIEVDDVAVMFFGIPMSYRYDEERRKLMQDFQIASTKLPPSVRDVAYIVLCPCNRTKELPVPEFPQKAKQEDELHRLTIFLGLSNDPSNGHLHDTDHNNLSISQLIRKFSNRQ